MKPLVSTHTLSLEPRSDLYDVETSFGEQSTYLLEKSYQVQRIDDYTSVKVPKNCLDGRNHFLLLMTPSNAPYVPSYVINNRGLKIRVMTLKKKKSLEGGDKIDSIVGRTVLGSDKLGQKLLLTAEPATDENHFPWQVTPFTYGGEKYILTTKVIGRTRYKLFFILS